MFLLLYPPKTTAKFLVFRTSLLRYKDTANLKRYLIFPSFWFQNKSLAFETHSFLMSSTSSFALTLHCWPALADELWALLRFAHHCVLFSHFAKHLLNLAVVSVARPVSGLFSDSPLLFSAHSSKQGLMDKWVRPFKKRKKKQLNSS